jgi:Alpha-N-acetylglucosaminidase (NAGLU) C-terminal domain
VGPTSAFVVRSVKAPLSHCMGSRENRVQKQALVCGCMHLLTGVRRQCCRYDPAAVAGAWGQLLSGADVLAGTSTYLYDLADVGRQVLVLDHDGPT